MKHPGYILLPLLLALFTALPGQARKDNSPELFLQVETSEKNLYAGVPFCLSVRLFSSVQEINGASPLSDFNLDDLGFIYIPDVYDAVDQESREEYKGRKYYTCPLAEFSLLPPRSGSFEVVIPDFVISVVTGTRVVRDPFWGAVRRPVREEFQVEGKKIRLKVSDLPSRRPDNFSGGCGTFEVDIKAPSQMSKGASSDIYVIVSGHGDLSKASWPDLLSQLPQGLGVRSVSQDCEMMVDRDGKIFSRLVFECVCSPAEDGRITVPSLSFCYFDTASRKFRTAESRSVNIHVEEDSLPGAPPSYQEI